MSDRAMHKARAITTVEGKFINVADCIAALKDDTFVMACAEMLKVGHEKGDPTVVIVRHCLGAAFMELAGEDPEQRKGR